MVLGNYNNYTGQTTVNAGVLMLNYSNTLNLTVNGGTVATCRDDYRFKSVRHDGVCLTATGGETAGAISIATTCLPARSTPRPTPTAIRPRLTRRWGCRNGNNGTVVFNVARGSHSPPVDLNVTGAIGSNSAARCYDPGQWHYRALARANVSGTLTWEPCHRLS